MILPSQINALVYANDEQIASQIYIPITEYIKIKDEKQKLESLVITLQSQLNENIQLRQTMQTEIDNLNKQIIDLNTQLVSLNVMKDEFDKIKLYQKMADSFNDIKDNMYYVFCDPSSKIYCKSYDNGLYYLKKHLYEFHTKKNIGIKVRQNMKLWSEIYDDVKKIILSDFGIDDIEVFFEIIELIERRNTFSHTSTKITLDELKEIALYPDQIFNCLNRPQI